MRLSSHKVSLNVSHHACFIFQKYIQLVIWSLGAPIYFLSVEKISLDEKTVQQALLLALHRIDSTNPQKMG